VSPTLVEQRAKGEREMLWFLISLFLIGIVAGYAARLLVPGPDPMSFGQTVLLGVIGSFVGGLLGGLVFAGEIALSAAGIVGSIIGAVIALLVYRAMSGSRTTTRSGARTSDRDPHPVR
jgi:uncharacterized membrane protein YeaQ/YmgE (transglycosylase-associated protein family)